MNIVVKLLTRNEKVRMCAIFLKNIPERYSLYRSIKRELEEVERCSNRIFYFGAARHANLGDLAQSVCIRNWLKKHYDSIVVEIETNAVVNTPFSVIRLLDKSIQEKDMIVFQSGYTTTDLGGFADEMHRVVMEHFPNNPMLMMPQTVLFINPENERRASECYDRIKKLLFLARDKVSYEKALKMFPNTRVELFPDIVTTMIGTMRFDYPRDGVLFCCRNDEEKYYSDDEIVKLMRRCGEITHVARTDTTKKKKREVIKKSEEYILNEIKNYAHYKLIVTDRYHGTILSLVAGTPVVLLKTTDHKVVTGADWFQGVYDGYVYLADDLDDAFEKVKELLSKKRNSTLEPYFESKYYDKLPEMFEEVKGK